MIIYADGGEIVDVCVAADMVRQQLASVTSNVDSLRELAITAGMLEQALHDAEHPSLAHSIRITDAAADAFYAAWSGTSTTVTPLRKLAAFPDLRSGTRVTVRTPEGFAYYALYPEQYCAAAREVVREGARAPILVLGLRSIGTTLSAVVAATLRAEGLQVARLTVRPSGHPFDRHVHLDVSLLRRHRLVLVVDEGPGLSGSSMAAAARAVIAAGVPCVLLPGHASGPGAAASPEVKSLWQTLRSHVVGVDAPLFAGRDLHSHLAEALAAEPVSDEEWGTQTATFVSPRYRVRDGVQTWALEFAGTTPGSADAALRALQRCAAAGFALAPRAAGAGFIARPWVEGTSSSTGDDVPALISRYVAAMADTPLTADVLARAHERRVAWSLHNIAERFGAKAADRSRRVLDGGYPLRAPWTNAAFDYDMAPSRWTRTAAGTLLRNGSVGRAHGHTVVGIQPVVWDVAALIVRWQLRPSQTARWLAAVERAFEASLPQGAVDAFVLAVDAFDLGCQALRPALAAQTSAHTLRHDG